MNQRTVVALDIGRSAVKAMAHANGQTYRIIFPSIVSRATTIFDEAARLAAEIDTVDVRVSEAEGSTSSHRTARYFTGETARLQGNASTTVGLNHDWIQSPEYQALVLAARKQFAALGVTGLENALIVVGTPSSLFHTQRMVMQAATYDAWPATVKVLSQPMGAYLSFVMDHDGKIIRERYFDEYGTKKSWAVIDIGHYTTDYLLMKEGVNQQGKAESGEGISKAVKNLQQILLNNRGMTVDALRGEVVLREKRIKHMGSYVPVEKEVESAILPVAENIIEHAITIFSKEVSILDGILLAGGGAEMVHSQLVKKWSHVALTEEPRMAIVEGYLRYGKGAVATEAAKQMADQSAA